MGSIGSTRESGESPRVTAQSMNEQELRTYIRDNNLTQDYNIMLNNRRNASYQTQLNTMRDLVADNMAVRNAVAGNNPPSQERIAQSLMSKYESSNVSTKRTISALRDAARTTKTTTSGIETTLAKAATKEGAFNVDFNSAATRTKVKNMLNSVAPNTYEFRQVTRPSNNKMMKQVVEWRLFKK